MGRIIEKKTIRVQYRLADKYINDSSKFGWILVSKQLINRFGNPVPIGEYISEDDLKEKCAFDLQVKREIDEKNAVALHSLENEYNSFTPYSTGFGGGRVVGCIFLSILSFACYIAGVLWLQTPGIALAIALFLLGFFVFGVPIIIIFATGCAHVVRAGKKNLELEKQKEKIVEQAKPLLQ